MLVRALPGRALALPLWHRVRAVWMPTLGSAALVATAVLPARPRELICNYLELGSELRSAGEVVTEAANRAWIIYGRPVPPPDNLRAHAEASIPRSRLGQDPDTDVATLVSKLGYGIKPRAVGFGQQNVACRPAADGCWYYLPCGCYDARGTNAWREREARDHARGPAAASGCWADGRLAMTMGRLSPDVAAAQANHRERHRDSTNEDAGDTSPDLWRPGKAGWCGSPGCSGRVRRDGAG